MNQPIQSHVTSAFYGMVNPTEFYRGIQTAINQVPSQGVFAGDNLFTYARNLSFLEDERFMEAFEKHTETEIEK